VTVREELLEYVVERYLKGERPAGFNCDSDLIGSGILTSLALVDLLCHVERRYAIRIGEVDLVPENFETIGAVESLIQVNRHTSVGG
jgi:acyl carrier protein